MKVLLKSIRELKEEYDIERRDGYLLIDGHVIVEDILGKVVEAKYDKKSDSYVVDDWYFNSNFIKGIAIGYTIKRLNENKVYTLSF